MSRSETRALRPLVLAVITIATYVTAPLATAQAVPRWHLTIIVSATGGGPLGQRHAFAADRAASALRRDGLYGQGVRVDVLDDGGDPRRAETLARDAVADGTLALVCCTIPAAADRVTRVAEEGGTLLVALDGARPAAASWVLQLAPTLRTQMTAVAVHAAAEGKASLGLVTLDDAFGTAAEEAFVAALSDTGRSWAGVARYGPAAAVLTPEALWMATREPGSVIAWGFARDTRLAVDALRRRGYYGPLYVRPEALPSEAWGSLALHDAAARPIVPHADDPWHGVRIPVAPAALLAALPPEHPSASAVASFLSRVLAGDPAGLSRAEVVDLALLDDAVQLVRRAFEATAGLGLPTGSSVVTLRSAVHDVLLSATPVHLAAGAYAPRTGQSAAARWDGLVVAVVGPAGGR
jgi:hypothetical protein